VRPSHATPSPIGPISRPDNTRHHRLPNPGQLLRKTGDLLAVYHSGSAPQNDLGQRKSVFSRGVDLTVSRCPDILRFVVPDRPHRLEDQDSGLSSLLQGFESPWGHLSSRQFSVSAGRPTQLGWSFFSSHAFACIPKSPTLSSPFRHAGLLARSGHVTLGEGTNMLMFAPIITYAILMATSSMQPPR
jgi:hypothetical protein